MKKKSSNNLQYSFDPLFRLELRFFIMSILAMYEEVDFKFLKEELKATDGNLSVNLKKLEEAGYLISKKEFVARKPRTTYRITNRGVEQLKQYLEKMSFFKERIEKGLS